MTPQNHDEENLLSKLKELYHKKARIQLQLWPDIGTTISPKAINKCRVESNDIPERVIWFGKISEPYYDYLVTKYHNKWKKI